ncbi:hypothetical protein IFM89_013289, partial [Coptis chinensis]
RALSASVKQLFYISSSGIYKQTIEAPHVEGIADNCCLMLETSHILGKSTSY